MHIGTDGDLFHDFLRRRRAVVTDIGTCIRILQNFLPVGFAGDGVVQAFHELVGAGFAFTETEREVVLGDICPDTRQGIGLFIRADLDPLALVGIRQHIDHIFVIRACATGQNGYGRCDEQAQKKQFVFF